ncbi:YraN family protein [Flavonifractor sp. An4]|uniref:YraN family protein n=1 Tax=Flavonifractor sp. An4 TaxID=1965634 RepID=UPI000B39C6BD|nr:YraN family protein [Flavonifractor sp. An4]OUO17684.1 YraN family protein [Flavonifractor sp. An4]
MSGGEAKLLGRWGEAKAAEQLRQRGYTIVAAGYHCRFGEIDLIATTDKYLCFIEVKLRKNDSFAPGRAAVDRWKQQKLRTTAECWLAEHPDMGLQPRFDVAELYAPQGMATREPEFHYWENAF